MAKFIPVSAALALAMGLAAAPVHANEEAAVSDPYQWLEGVEDPKALDWVKAQNAKAEAELAATPELVPTPGKGIFVAQRKTPQVTLRGFGVRPWR